jgi:hypothetical protein
VGWAMIETGLDYRVPKLEQLMERMPAAQERAHQGVERTSREMRKFKDKMTDSQMGKNGQQGPLLRLSPTACQWPWWT